MSASNSATVAGSVEGPKWTHEIVEWAELNVSLFPRIKYSTMSEIYGDPSRTLVRASNEPRNEATREELEAKWAEAMEAIHSGTVPERDLIRGVDFSPVIDHPHVDAGGSNVLVPGLGSLTDKNGWDTAIRLHVAVWRLFTDLRNARPLSRLGKFRMMQIRFDDPNYSEIDRNFLSQEFRRSEQVRVFTGSRGQGLRFLRQKNSLVVLLGATNPYRQIMADLIPESAVPYDDVPIGIISRPHEDQRGRDETSPRVRDNWLGHYYDPITTIFPADTELYGRICLHIRRVDIPGGKRTGKAPKKKTSKTPIVPYEKPPGKGKGKTKT
ncbi:hypothetical protein K491DRAFT_749866 [Lophiostoma macrostomum CBS 122681]|uniref:Uncharacterized protein n=1 Tax=Lophiostoma macrostomum CBS 122681 TaxID=1314788 RepID=A0A6A6T361_9PLEO|nr:hypothetical protein K491DRAFT_749866 [Lophiostoma macrostomum CBS 122681]